MTLSTLAAAHVRPIQTGQPSTLLPSTTRTPSGHGQVEGGWFGHTGAAPAANGRPKSAMARSASVFAVDLSRKGVPRTASLDAAGFPPE